MKGAVAAGHPLTAEVGARTLERGGNAVDACVAAGFASWVTESPLTGPGGGGFMLFAGPPERRAPMVAALEGAGAPCAPVRFDLRGARSGQTRGRR